MKTKTFREFQTTTVQAAVTALGIAKAKYDEAPPEQRALITAHHSVILLEAPTGSGKTLMAAAAVEQFTQTEDVVWFWFAPFKGVIAQTLSFLKGECSTLRLRDLGSDRKPEQARRGDVFVTSWQSVAVRDTNQRTVRRERENAPSLDLLISGLREKGLRIGIVVDEAHHSFSAGSQAAALCRDVLKPDYTLLVTATPDDRDIEKWQQSQGVQAISRLSVSRTDAVKAGLIKEGVKAVAFKAAQESQRDLVDYEGAALSAGVRMHRLIQQRLSEAGIPLKPLLMVQVDSEEKDSVAEAKARLLKLGFAEDAIVTHTATEPDPGLAGLPNDESKEVLIFKMAVAQGFDVPRAWCLVTMRRARDENYGVQIIGRILRVHRRLFAKTELPELLNYGYVFLAHPELQTGLEAAGDRLNEFRTQCGLVAPTRTALVTLGGKPEVQQTDEGGQTWIFTPETPVFGAGGQGGAGQGELNFGLEGEIAPEGGFEGEAGGTGGFLPGLVVSVLAGETSPKPGTGPAASVSPKKAYSYPLRPNMPRQFKTCLLPEETGGLENECARHFFVTSDALIAAMAAKVAVHQTTVEVFTHLVQMELLKAEMDADEVARRANELLARNEGFHAKELKKALRSQLRKIVEDKGLPGFDDGSKIDALLHTLLIADKGASLRSAQKKALAGIAAVELAGELPAVLESETRCPPSMRNVYGILPPKLNSWETAFAQLLDQLPEGTVLWWHRNEVKELWSVAMVMPNGKAFYPDFVIGIENRTKHEGVLLADPKAMYETTEAAAKILAEHPVYGRAMIVARNATGDWAPVVWDEANHKAVQSGPLDWKKAEVW